MPGADRRPATDAAAERGDPPRPGGAGLGVALARRLVTLMGGRIGQRGKHGLGPLFWFEVPMETATPAKAASPAAREPVIGQATPVQEGSRAAGTPIRILVAEDHETNRRLAMLMLDEVVLEMFPQADEAPHPYPHPPRPTRKEAGAGAGAGAGGGGK